MPSSKQYIETNQSRKECLKTVVEELNAIGDVSQEKVRIELQTCQKYSWDFKKLSENCHFNIGQSQCRIENILPVEKYYTLTLTVLTFINPVIVLVGAYFGLVKQVIYMEENIEKIGLGKGSRKNGSTTTNHIDNIGMSVSEKRHIMATELYLPVARQNDFLSVVITQIQVVTVTSICFGFVICLGPYYIFAAFRILGVAFLRNNNACDIWYHVSLVLIQVTQINDYYISFQFFSKLNPILVFSSIKRFPVFISRFKISSRTLSIDFKTQNSFNQQVVKHFKRFHVTKSWRSKWSHHFSLKFKA